MNPIERLRLKTNPKPGKPPAGQVDFVYSETLGGMAIRDSGGNDTPVTGGGAVADADNVLGAIEDFDPDQQEAARDTLEVYGATEQSAGIGLRNLQAAAGFSTPVSFLIIGDSFNIGYFAGLDRLLIKGDFRCKQVTGGGDSGVTVHSVATGNADYTKSPDGLYYEIASGGNLTCGHLQYGVAGPADQVHYTLFPGTGTAQLQYSYSGGAWTNVGSAIDTTLITSVQAATVALPFGYTDSVRCRVTATGGIVNGWIGMSMEGPGIMVANFAYTGQSMAQTMSVGETIWKALITAYSTDLVISSWADARFIDAAGTFDAVGDDNWADGGPFDRAYVWSKAAAATLDWIFISPHQVDPTYDMVANATLDANYAAVGVGTKWDERTVYSIPFIREFALSRGEAYVDTYHMFNSWAEADAQGMYSDEVHLSDTGKAYKANLVYSRSGLDIVFGTKAAGGLAINGYIFAPNQNFGQGPGLTLYNYRGIPQTLFAGSIYFMDATRPDGVGGVMSYTSNGAQVGTFVGGSYFGHANFNSFGVHPVTNGTGALGKVAQRWEGVFSNGVSTGTASKTTTYAALATDYTILCDATAGAFDVDLPAAASHTGRIYVIKKVDASGNAVSIDPNASELIDGSSSSATIATQWGAITIQSNGTSWFILNRYLT